MNAKAIPSTSDFVSPPARLFATAAKLGTHPAYYVRDQAGWQATSWQTYAEQVQQAARALLALGVQKGECICILGYNRPEWVIMDLAAMCIGAVAAGIYFTNSADEVAYIVQHSACRIMLVENATQYQKIRNANPQPEQLERVILMRNAVAEFPGQLSWQDFIALGDASHQAEFQSRLHALQPYDLGTLIYTSGTTGPSKAVMLSHYNLSWTADAMSKSIACHQGDRLISYLPLAHIAEQMTTIHTQLCAGYTIYYANGLEALADHLREVRPTIFFGVPRVWEKMQASIALKLRAASGLKSTLAHWAMRTARTWHDLNLQGKPVGCLLNWKMQVARKLVLNKIKQAIGLDQGRMLISAAAAIAQEHLHFFCGLDLVVREVYGQSENCGPTTLNLPGKTRLGSVGPVLAGTGIKLGDDGEILIRGPHVFTGYLHQAEASAEALRDGWLYTGDLGELDSDGYVYITGRKKDLLITSGGKNISPANIEAALMSAPLIEHAVVCGDGRHFLSALLTVKQEAVTNFAHSKGLEPGADLLQHPLVLAEIQQEIDAINQHHAKVAAIRKFTILPQGLSVDGGELTATMKVRRKKIIEQNRDLVEKMYAESE